jgi:hypothetical protein
MTTQSQIWAFYMLSTVGRMDYSHRSVPLKFFFFFAARCRCPRISSCRNAIRATTPVVFPLLGFPRGRVYQHSTPDSCFPLQISRWYFSFRMFFLIFIPLPTECLAEIGQAVPESGSHENRTLRHILGVKAVHMLAFFILVYVGVEVTVASSC